MGILASAEAGGMDGVLSAMDTVISFGGKILTFCTTNPVLMFCLACGLAGAGIAVIAKVKNFATSG